MEIMKNTTNACSAIHRPGMIEWGASSGRIKELDMAHKRFEAAVISGNVNKTKAASDFYWVTYKTLLLDFIDASHGYVPTSMESK